MFRIHQIYLKKDSKSSVTLSKLKEVVEKKLNRSIISTKISTTEGKTRIKIVLKYPISLQNNNRIFRILNEEGITVKKICWEEKGGGDFETGIMEVTVS